MRRFVTIVAVLAAAFAVMSPAAQAAGPPHVKGTETVPVYDYANAIRESVWVTTPLDNDGDGAKDKVVVDLIRPREAAAKGVKVPVIMIASPYYVCCGRGNESEKKLYGPDGTVTRYPLHYDNYFVPRGYAIAQVDLAGTNRSTGCNDVGGREEVLGAKAAVDWLNGRAPGAYADGKPAKANWSTGKVGMIGKSWDGTMANGVAATGVRGLETIVPISAISSWYDYSRYNGIVRSTGHHAFLHDYVGGRPEAACAALRQELVTGSEDETGDYNDYWAERNYLPDASKVRASVFVVHGVNDLNVQTSHFAKWWTELAENGVPRKIWLAQQGHVDPFDFRRAEWVETLHEWFDYWLQGLRNGAMREPQASLERSSGKWVDEPRWPAVGAHNVTVRLGNGDGTTGTLGWTSAPRGTTRTFTDDPGLFEDEAVASPNTATPGRLAFLSGALRHDLRISGQPSVTLRVRVDSGLTPTTGLAVRLVDYGTANRVDYLSPGSGIHNLTTESCWGAQTATDDGCYKDTAEDFATRSHAVLTRGWIDAAHRSSLRQATPLQPNRWYEVKVPVQAYDAVVPKGHVLGLVVTASDEEFSTPMTTGATIDVDLRGSSIRLPAAGLVSLPSITTPPVVTTDATVSAKTTGHDWRNPEFR